MHNCKFIKPADSSCVLPCQRSVPKTVMTMMQDAELEGLHDLFASVGELPQPNEDISAAQWLRQQGASERMLAGMPLHHAIYAEAMVCRAACTPYRWAQSALTPSWLVLRSGRSLLCKRLRLLAGAAGTVRDDHREPALGLRSAPCGSPSSGCDVFDPRLTVRWTMLLIP